MNEHGAKLLSRLSVVVAVASLSLRAELVTRFPAHYGPVGITAGPDGNLWFTTIYYWIGRITPLGGVTYFPLTDFACSGPDDLPPGCGGRGITSGPDGNLWFVLKDGLPRVSRMTTTGLMTAVHTPEVGSHLGIATGLDGNIWTAPIGGLDSNVILRITPMGGVSSFPIPSQTGQEGRGTQSLAPGSDGNIWFTEFSQRAIGKITPAGLITEVQLPPVDGITPTPVVITAGPDGVLWFTAIAREGIIGRITTAGQIDAYRIPDHSASPQGICSGPDGNLWFTDLGTGKLGRCTPSGVIDEIPLPAGTNPYGIAAGPDGNIWFTMPSYGIGRLNLAEVNAVPVPAIGGPALVFVALSLAVSGALVLRNRT